MYQPSCTYSAVSLFCLSVSDLPESVRNGMINIIFSDYMKACIESSVFKIKDTIV